MGSGPSKGPLAGKHRIHIGSSRGCWVAVDWEQRNRRWCVVAECMECGLRRVFTRHQFGTGYSMPLEHEDHQQERTKGPRKSDVAASVLMLVQLAYGRVRQDFRGIGDGEARKMVELYLERAKGEVMG